MVQQLHGLAVVWTAHRAQLLVSERLHWGLHYYFRLELNLGRPEVELGVLRRCLQSLGRAEWVALLARIDCPHELRRRLDHLHLALSCNFDIALLLRSCE